MVAVAFNTCGQEQHTIGGLGGYRHTWSSLSQALKILGFGSCFRKPLSEIELHFLLCYEMKVQGHHQKGMWISPW